MTQLPSATLCSVSKINIFCRFFLYIAWRFPCNMVYNFRFHPFVLFRVGPAPIVALLQAHLVQCLYGGWFVLCGKDPVNRVSFNWLCCPRAWYCTSGGFVTQVRMWAFLRILQKAIEVSIRQFSSEFVPGELFAGEHFDGELLSSSLTPGGYRFSCCVFFNFWWTNFASRDI